VLYQLKKVVTKKLETAIEMEAHIALETFQDAIG